MGIGDKDTSESGEIQWSLGKPAKSPLNCVTCRENFVRSCGILDERDRCVFDLRGLPENMPELSFVLIKVLFVREIYASDVDGVETARLYGNVNKPFLRRLRSLGFCGSEMV